MITRYIDITIPRLQRKLAEFFERTAITDFVESKGFTFKHYEAWRMMFDLYNQSHKPVDMQCKSCYKHVYNFINKLLNP